MLIITVGFIGVTAGYMLARVPVAGTFEVSTSNIAVMPSPSVSQSVTASEVEYVPATDASVDIELLPFEEAQTDEPEVDASPEVDVLPSTSPSPSPSPTPEPKPSYTPKPEPSGPVNINTAGLDELQTLPGIGPAIAQRIIDERAYGAFISVEDLERVKGIGEKTVEKLKPYVVV